MLKKLWNDPVWSKVIAGAILTLAAAVGTYLFDWGPSIWRFLQGIVELALASTSVPNWFIGLLVVLALPAAFLMIVLMRQAVWPSSVAPSWRSYTTDTFFGIRWRWRYFDDGQIYDLFSFCTDCDFQIFPENVSAFRAVDHFAFRCESCGRKLGEFEESVVELESKIKRFIQQKIRNGTWAIRGA